MVDMCTSIFCQALLTNYNYAQKLRRVGWVLDSYEVLVQCKTLKMTRITDSRSGKICWCARAPGILSHHCTVLWIPIGHFPSNIAVPHVSCYARYPIAPCKAWICTLPTHRQCDDLTSTRCCHAWPYIAYLPVLGSSLPLWHPNVPMYMYTCASSCRNSCCVKRSFHSTCKVLTPCACNARMYGLLCDGDKEWCVQHTVHVHVVVW